LVPKVLHKICGRPMLQFVLDTVEKLKPERKIVVLGRHAVEIERHYGEKVYALYSRKSRRERETHSSRHGRH